MKSSLLIKNVPKFDDFEAQLSEISPLLSTENSIYNSNENLIIAIDTAQILSRIQSTISSNSQLKNLKSIIFDFDQEKSVLTSKNLPAQSVFSEKFENFSSGELLFFLNSNTLNICENQIYKEEENVLSNLKTLKQIENVKSAKFLKNFDLIFVVFEDKVQFLCSDKFEVFGEIFIEKLYKTEFENDESLICLFTEQENEKRCQIFEVKTLKKLFDKNFKNFEKKGLKLKFDDILFNLNSLTSEKAESFNSESLKFVDSKNDKRIFYDQQKNSLTFETKNFTTTKQHLNIEDIKYFFGNGDFVVCSITKISNNKKTFLTEIFCSKIFSVPVFENLKGFKCSNVENENFLILEFNSEVLYYSLKDGKLGLLKKTLSKNLKFELQKKFLAIFENQNVEIYKKNKLISKFFVENCENVFISPNCLFVVVYDGNSMTCYDIDGNQIWTKTINFLKLLKFKENKKVDAETKTKVKNEYEKYKTEVLKEEERDLNVRVKFEKKDFDAELKNWLVFLGKQKEIFLGE